MADEPFPTATEAPLGAPLPQKSARGGDGTWGDGPWTPGSECLLHSDPKSWHRDPRQNPPVALALQPIIPKRTTAKSPGGFPREFPENPRRISGEFFGEADFRGTLQKTIGEFPENFRRFFLGGIPKEAQQGLPKKLLGHSRREGERGGRGVGSPATWSRSLVWPSVAPHGFARPLFLMGVPTNAKKPFGGGYASAHPARRR